MSILLAILSALCLLSAVFAAANLLEFRKVDARRMQLLGHLGGFDADFARRHRPIKIAYISGTILLPVALLLIPFLIR